MMSIIKKINQKLNSFQSKFRTMTCYSLLGRLDTGMPSKNGLMGNMEKHVGK